MSVKKKLLEVEELFDSNLITEEEYNEMRDNILSLIKESNDNKSNTSNSRIKKPEENILEIESTLRAIEMKRNEIVKIASTDPYRGFLDRRLFKKFLKNFVVTVAVGFLLGEYQDNEDFYWMVQNIYENIVELRDQTGEDKEEETRIMINRLGLSINHPMLN